DPEANQKAIDPAPGRPGTFTASVDAGDLQDWPTEIADCARVAGAPLPSLKPAGGPVTWTLSQAPTDLVTQGTSDTVLGTDNTAHLRYTTTQESADLAQHGRPAHGTVRVDAALKRKELEQLQTSLVNI